MANCTECRIPECYIARILNTNNKKAECHLEAQLAKPNPNYREIGKRAIYCAHQQNILRIMATREPHKNSKNKEATIHSRPKRSTPVPRYRRRTH